MLALRALLGLHGPAVNALKLFETCEQQPRCHFAVVLLVGIMVHHGPQTNTTSLAWPYQHGLECGC